MKIQRARETKLNLVKNSVKVAVESPLDKNSTGNPVIKKVKDTSVRLSGTDRKKLSLENYMSRREQKKWKKLSSAKKTNIIRKFSRKHDFKYFEQVINQNEYEKSLAVEDSCNKSEKNFHTNRGKGSIKKQAEYDEYGSQLTIDKSLDHSNLHARLLRNTRTISEPNKTQNAHDIVSGTVHKSAAIVQSASSASMAASTITTASTGGTSEIVKAGTKATRKLADSIKSTLDNQNEINSTAGCTETHNSDIAISNTSMNFFQKVGMLFAMVIAFLAQTIGVLFIPIILAIIVVIVVVTLLVSILSAVASLFQSSTTSNTMTMMLSQATLAYYDEVHEAAIDNNIEGYTDYLMAIIEVESHGEGDDIMQASESAGKEPNSLSSSESIAQGTKYFAECLSESLSSNCDVETAIQSYNYGSGFINYVAERGGNYTFELASFFAEEKANGVKIDYSNPIAVAENGGWRFLYGNMFYVKLVQQYIAIYKNDTVRTVITEARKYEGTDYVSGGSDPDSGFDCSGLVQWCYGQADIALPRTAQQQYDECTHLSMDEAKAGDLIFFTNTTVSDNYITHVGIYLGNGKIFEAGDPLGVYDMTNEWHTTHFVCCGRVIDSLDNEEESE